MTTVPGMVGETQPTPPSPDAILELGLAFWGSKALLSAVEFGVFSELAAGPLDAEALRERLGLHRRGASDFFDALVALGLLEREGIDYRNTPATGLFLDRAKPSYIGGILELTNGRIYRNCGSLTEALRTGRPQNEIKTGGDFFTTIYENPDERQVFLKGMSGISAGVAQRLAVALPWERYRTVIDIGCAEGCVPVQVALAHHHLTGGGFDLPRVKPFFDDYVAAAGVGDRLRFYPGDFFADELPSADVLIVGQILHDWNLEEKRLLLAKAHRALSDGGALIVYDTIIDDDRRENAFGLLMSLNMLVETHGGFDYTYADCQQWMSDTGFQNISTQHLAGPHSMVVGIK